MIYIICRGVDVMLLPGVSFFLFVSRRFRFFAHHLPFIIFFFIGVFRGEDEITTFSRGSDKRTQIVDLITNRKLLKVPNYLSVKLWWWLLECLPILLYDHCSCFLPLEQRQDWDALWRNLGAWWRNLDALLRNWDASWMTLGVLWRTLDAFLRTWDASRRTLGASRRTLDSWLRTWDASFRTLGASWKTWDEIGLGSLWRYWGSHWWDRCSLSKMSSFCKPS